MTEYVIFVQQEEAGTWSQVGQHVQARSATAAIRTLLCESNSPHGAYAAVPARSWKPVTVKVETKTALRFS